MIWRNEWQEILQGILLLLGCHVLAGFLTFLLGFLIHRLLGSSDFVVGFWVIAAITWFIWQLIYVVPLVVWLYQTRKIAVMKGVIVGALLTVFINSGCFILMLTR